MNNTGDHTSSFARQPARDPTSPGAPHPPAGARSCVRPRRSGLGLSVLTGRRLGHQPGLQAAGAAPLGTGESSSRARSNKEVPNGAAPSARLRNDLVEDQGTTTSTGGRTPTSSPERGARQGDRGLLRSGSRGEHGQCVPTGKVVPERLRAPPTLLLEAIHELLLLLLLNGSHQDVQAG